MSNVKSFDYIVVGAGSAGCVVAGNLIKRSNHTVLLIEAGPEDTSLWMKIPMGYGKSFYNPSVNWMYITNPIAGFNGRESYWPRGKVLGGSSSINAMVYIRGQQYDYDMWSQLTNGSWGWERVLDAYKKMETHPIANPVYHGSKGPLHISCLQDRDLHPLSKRFIEAGQNVGLPLNVDIGGESLLGVGRYQTTTYQGLRMSASRAWITPVRKHPNLTLLTNTLTKRVVFEGKKAIGVEVLDANGASKVYYAQCEVILSAGAVDSPKILQLSGIGQKSLLDKFSIPVVYENNNVGQHLQDHLCYDLVFKSSQPSLNDQLNSLFGKIKIAAQYLLKREGVLALSLNQAGGFFKLSEQSQAPDVQLYFSPLSYEKAPPRERPLLNPDEFSGFSTSISPCHPKSRGFIEIASNDVRVPAQINPNYLNHEDDIRVMREAVRYLEQLCYTSPLKDVIEARIQPRSSIEMDSDLEQDIRERSYSVFHPCGTCRMGKDEVSSVVDTELRVHGVQHLRVIDASVFPTITSGNINGPSMMVGQIGVDLILEN